MNHKKVDKTDVDTANRIYIFPSIKLFLIDINVWNAYATKLCDIQYLEKERLIRTRADLLLIWVLIIIYSELRLCNGISVCSREIVCFEIF